MGLTAEFCEKIVATRWEDLNEEAIRRTRRIILDGIAAPSPERFRRKRRKYWPPMSKHLADIRIDGYQFWF